MMRLTTLAIALLIGAWNPAGVRAGEEKKTLDVLGLERTYRLHIPPSAAGKPLPAVIVLHGMGGTSFQIEGYFGLDAVADREGFVAVYPQGLGGFWGDVRFADQPDMAKQKSQEDVAFLNVLAGVLASEGIADPARIYLAGISNGGVMASTMACLSPRKFAGFAVINATGPVLARDMCHAAKPRPMLLMNGTADPINFWDGERAEKIGYLGGDDFFELWSRLNGCRGRDEEELADIDALDNSRVVLVTPRVCPPQGQTAMYRINGGGHHPPTLEQRPSGTFRGQRNHDIEAAEVVWQFFQKVGRLDP